MNPSKSADAILRDRAQALAQVVEPLRAKSIVEMLEFRLAEERYALEIGGVHEVYPLRDLTPLPATPPFLRGIVNVRGRIVPVLDLRRFFDLPERGFDDLHRIILVRRPEMELGILADLVVGVREVDVGRLQVALPTLVGIREQYLRGVTEDRCVVLDVDRILDDPRILVNDEEV